MHGQVSGFIRSHLLGVAACFIALMGAAVIANAGEPDREAEPSAASPAKQVKKLKKRLAGFEARIAALEGKPAASVPAIPTTLPPSGPASGDLSGAYPGPQIAPGAIVRADLADTLDVAGNSLGVGGPGQFGVPGWDGVLLTTGGIDFRDANAPTSLIRPDGSALFDGNVSTDQIFPNHIRLVETSDPGAPPSNQGNIFLREAGGGNTELVVKWRDNSVDVLAVGPVN